MTDIQRLVVQLQAALGLQIHTGQITLNLSEATLQSFETKTYQRIVHEKDLDRACAVRSN